MADLKTLFNERDVQFVKETLKIFKEINTTLGCVTTYLSDTNEAISQGVIGWEDASTIDDSIVFVGMVNYEIGSTIILGDEEFAITEENLVEFQSIVHMSIPFDLVERDDEQELMEYLYNFGEGKDPSEFTSMLLPQAAELDEEFDLTELSEEQRQSLKLQTPKGGH